MLQMARWVFLDSGGDEMKNDNIILPITKPNLTVGFVRKPAN